ncbi:hypothetical protein PTI98_013510 [Pleurotus ostreatus]|nr:hypothetical protein PTI98_013510 [Pleurotus ostreatus]
MITGNNRRFGGNPEEVTIAGESAGGASVVMQTVAFGGTAHKFCSDVSNPIAHDVAGTKALPFKRAIAQSIGFGPTPTSDEVEAIFKNVSSTVGCTGRNVMQCLRSAFMGAIVSAINQNTVIPVIDGPGGFLPDLPSRLIASGKFSNVEFIGGHCTNDGRTFVVSTPEQFNTEDDTRRFLLTRWSRITMATMEKAFQLYPAPDSPGSPFETEYARAAQMFQDIVYSCMYDSGLHTLLNSLTGVYRDIQLASKLTQRGVNGVFTFRLYSSLQAIE